MSTVTSADGSSAASGSGRLGRVRLVVDGPGQPEHQGGHGPAGESGHQQGSRDPECVHRSPSDPGCGANRAVRSARSIAAAGLAAHSSCQPDLRTARLTDCSVIPSSLATCFWLPCLPSRSCWARGARPPPATGPRCAPGPAVRSGAAPPRRWRRPWLRLPRHCGRHLRCHGAMLPDTTDNGTWPAAALARSTALRAATKPAPDPSRGLRRRGRSTAPTPIPTYQWPLRRACRAMSTTSAGSLHDALDFVAHGAFKRGRW